MNFTTQVVLLALCLPTASLAAPATLFKVDGATSSLRYKIVHKFHESEGVTKEVEGAADLRAKQALVQVRAKVVGFDSGNGNRDAHMKEVVDAARFPDVMLKGTLVDFVAPTVFPSKTQAKLQGSLTFHGQTQPVTVPVVLAFASADDVQATASFDVSLEAFKIERPSLMFVKIDDACRITADLHFKR